MDEDDLTEAELRGKEWAETTNRLHHHIKEAETQCAEHSLIEAANLLDRAAEEEWAWEPRS